MSQGGGVQDDGFGDCGWLGPGEASADIPHCRFGERRGGLILGALCGADCAFDQLCVQLALWEFVYDVWGDGAGVCAERDHHWASRGVQRAARPDAADFGRLLGADDGPAGARDAGRGEPQVSAGDDDSAGCGEPPAAALPAALVEADWAGESADGASHVHWVHGARVHCVAGDEGGQDCAGGGGRLLRPQLGDRADGLGLMQWEESEGFPRKGEEA